MPSLGAFVLPVMSSHNFESFNKVVYTSREAMSTGFSKNLDVLPKQVEQHLPNGELREVIPIPHNRYRFPNSDRAALSPPGQKL